jgi:TolA-binding protein
MKRHRALLLLVLIISLFFSGCVYFNTLYNAKKLYNTARERPLINGKPSPQSVDDYTKAMKKCGYILTEYKNSSYANQALFLLAECLYYKGNSNLQAYEKCQDFKKFYPNDKLIPEVIIFESIILHDMKKNDEAVSNLQSLLTEPKYKKYYPRTYLYLSVISMDEKAYAQAQYYLQKIIDNYPHSHEYKDAFFQLGYAYHLEKKYAQSSQVFQKLLKSRLEKQIKLDARYYIALNDFYMKNYRKVSSEIKSLSKAESRADKIPVIQLLKARNLFGLNLYKEGVSLYETIIKDNPRTLSSAEANYYLGEFNLNYEHDYEKAITFYSNVKTESYLSPFVEDALSKSAIASQIILYNKKDSNLSITVMVNQQLKLAEYYLHNMNLPDSALSVYKGIIANRNQLQTQLDSLEQHIAYLDSLGVPKDTLEVMKSDSLNIGKNKFIPDSLKTMNQNVQKPEIYPPKQDSIAVIDTLKIEKRDVIIPKDQPSMIDSVSTTDSLRTLKSYTPMLKPTESVQDSTRDEKYDDREKGEKFLTPPDTVFADSSAVQDSVRVIKKKHIDTPQMQSLLAKERQLSANLMEYDSEYVPLAMYDELWIYKYSLPDSVRMEQVYSEMLAKYPLNKYTHAATMMLQGKPVVVTTEKEIADEELYNKAMELYSASPDSSKTILKSLAVMQDSLYSDKSKFTLGYLYWFNENDSLNAKPYFDELLKENRSSEYSAFILQFYDGKNFIFISELPAIIEMEARDKRRAEEAKAKELLQKSIKTVDHPLLREATHDYALPEMPQKPAVPNVDKDVKDTLNLHLEKPMQEEGKSILPRIESHISTVDQPQPKSDFRPYDFTMPNHPKKR